MFCLTTDVNARCLAECEYWVCESHNIHLEPDTFLYSVGTTFPVQTSGLPHPASPLASKEAFAENFCDILHSLAGRPTPDSRHGHGTVDMTTKLIQVPRFKGGGALPPRPATDNGVEFW
jgi:hypothetical protein